MKAKYTRRTLQAVLLVAAGASLVPNPKAGLWILIMIIAVFLLIASLKEIRE